jgi:hypothetical protein
VFVGLAVLGSLMDEEDEGDLVTGETTSTTQDESTEPTTAETTTTVATTTSTAPTTTTTQPPTTTTEGQTEQPDPVVFSGSGNEVIEFGNDLAWLTETFGIFEFQVAGSGNNAVWALDETFETADLLINTIGNHTGTRFISLTYDATGLEVDVSGEWTFTISPPTNMFPPLTAQDFNVPAIDTTGSIDGAAEEIVDWSGPGVIALRTNDRVVEITASGDGNIAMWAYSTTGETELLVNEIDQFQGSVLLPDCSDMCWIDIDGDMTYSLSIRP